MRAIQIAAILALASAAFALPHHRSHHAKATKSRGQLQADLARVHGKKAKLRAELRVTRQKAHAVKQDIVTVDTKLENVKSRLTRTRDRLSEERHNQAKAASRLVRANRELASTREQVRARLRFIYMQGRGSGFSVVAGTARAGDLASRGAVENAIERKDRELFNHYIELQHEAGDAKRSKDEAVKEIAILAKEEQTETRELADVRQEKGEVLDGLRTEQTELIQEIRQFDADEAEIAAQIEAYARMHSSSGRRGPAFTGRFIRPVDAPITSGFGMRFHPILHITRMHTGIDFGAPIGTPIHAAADGDVIATTFMNGYGHVVIIDHGSGISTVYAHTSRVFVTAGEHVRRGQEIAAVGNSGLSTGPHLHFEVRINGRPVNPLGHL